MTASELFRPNPDFIRRRTAIDVNGRTITAEVRDVSRHGVRVVLRGGLLPLQTLTLRWEDIERTARVMWSDGHQCGIQFDEPLSAGELYGIANAKGARTR